MSNKQHASAENSYNSPSRALATYPLIYNLIYILDYAASKECSCISLNYISKLLITIMSTNPSGLLAFFIKKPQIFSKLLSKSEESRAISETFAKLISEETQAK